MDELAVSSSFIEGLSTLVSAAGRAVHQSSAATTDGVAGLESTVAITALNESTAERVERAKLSAEAIAELASRTATVATKLRAVDQKLARAVETQ